MQHEIKTTGPLLDVEGNLTEPGYARHLLLNYDREKIKANPLRIKEWDYYLITNDHFGLALTIDDNSYMGLDSISFLDFDGKWEQTKSYMQAFTLGRKKLPQSSSQGNLSSIAKHYSISFERKPESRALVFSAKDFHNGEPISGRVVLTNEPAESMVIATPFDKPGHFYYNQKIVGMQASGEIRLGNKVFTFNPSDSFGILDWGRGVWTYKNTWYWSSASGLVGDKRFGWNLGYGFGNTNAASENMLFYEGVGHKLDQVLFNIPATNEGKEDYLSVWAFTSNNGRFEMQFTPILDRSAKTSAGIIESDQHQVFGRFSGKATLDDGTAIEVKDLLGFAEKVRNKW